MPEDMKPRKIQETWKIQADPMYPETLYITVHLESSTNPPVYELRIEAPNTEDPITEPNIERYFKAIQLVRILRQDQKGE